MRRTEDYRNTSLKFEESNSVWILSATWVHAHTLGFIFGGQVSQRIQKWNPFWTSPRQYLFSSSLGYLLRFHAIASLCTSFPHLGLLFPQYRAKLGAGGCTNSSLFYTEQFSVEFILLPYFYRLHLECDTNFTYRRFKIYEHQFQMTEPESN